MWTYVIVNVIVNVIVSLDLCPALSVRTNFQLVESRFLHTVQTIFPSDVLTNRVCYFD